MEAKHAAVRQQSDIRISDPLNTVITPANLKRRSVVHQEETRRDISRIFPAPNVNQHLPRPPSLRGVVVKSGRSGLFLHPLPACVEQSVLYETQPALWLTRNQTFCQRGLFWFWFFYLHMR